VDSTTNLAGDLQLVDDNIILTLDDTPNFYFTSSSIEFLHGKTHVFRRPITTGLTSGWEPYYLSDLEENMRVICAYNWQNGYTGTAPEIPAAHQVAICDITGDASPELLYIRDAAYTGAPGGVSSQLVIKSVGSDYVLREIYSCDGLDVLAGGGNSYGFFQIDGEPDLYEYYTYGDAYKAYDFYKLSLGMGGSIERTLLAQIRYDYYNGLFEYYNQYGQITESECNEICTSILSRISKIIFSGHIVEQLDSIVYNIFNTVQNISMTYDEAVAFLGGPSFTMPDLSAYIGERYAQVSWTFDPNYKDVINILEINGSEITFSVTFNRVWAPLSKLTARMSSDGTAYFREAETNFSGKLEFIDGNILMTIDDVPNFYGNTGSVEFFGSAAHLFKPRE